MAVKIRMVRPGATVLVTMRVLGGECRLKPTDAFNERVGALLAVLQDKHGMEIAQYVFMSNHFHLLLIVKHVTQLAGFMCEFNSKLVQISRSVHGGQPGIFWESRYHSVELCTAWEVEDKFRYVCAHGVKELLVDTPTDWPGLAGLKQWVDPGAHTPQGRVVCVACRRASEPSTNCSTCRDVAVVLTPLPRDAELDAGALSERMAEVSREIAAQYGGQVKLGVAGVENQEATSPPAGRDFERKQPSPPCVFACRTSSMDDGRAMEDELRSHFRETNAARREALRVIRKYGLERASFPASACVPQVVVGRLRVHLADKAVDGWTGASEHQGSQSSSAGFNPNYTRETAADSVIRGRRMRDGLTDPPG